MTDWPSIFRPASRIDELGKSEMYLQEGKNRGSSISRFLNRPSLNTLYGMKFYPDSWNYCINKLSSLVEESYGGPLPDTGSWMLFIPREFEDILDQIGMELLSEHGSKLVNYEIINLHSDRSKVLVKFTVCPFYDIARVNAVLEALGSQITVRRGNTFPNMEPVFAFFKPQILGLSSQNSMKPYVFSKVI